MHQIHTVAVKEHKFGGSSSSDLTLRISDIPIVAFGSRAHLEDKALATVESYCIVSYFVYYDVSFFYVHIMVNLLK